MKGDDFHKKNKNFKELRLSFFLLISFFLHFILSLSLILLFYEKLLTWREELKNIFNQSKNIIVNLNQDYKKKISSDPLLSDQNSESKGYLTLKKGDRWLNNSLDFSFGSQIKSKEQIKTKAVSKKKSSQDPNQISLTLKDGFINKNNSKKVSDQKPKSQFAIPDKDGITKENAIYYSNQNNFSFNTVKFKNFAYFKAMKDKIASNWYPPLMANASISGYNPITNTYTPGTMRIMAIPSQEVKIYFRINRQGSILDVYLIDSEQNESLDKSCLEAIKTSKNFGQVPKDLKGEVIGIPFIFGYYSY